MSQIVRPTPRGVGRSCVWVFGLVFCFVSTAHAGPGGGGGGGGPSIRIQVPRTITLQPILPQDILGGPDVRSVGATSVPLDLPTGAANANIGAAPGTSLGINPEVVRQVIGLWRIRSPRRGPAIPAVTIDYQLSSPLGVPDTLGLTALPSTTVDVVVVDLGYRITRRGGGRGGGRGRQDIEGDVEFRFQSNSLSRAGRYTGELMITVNFL